MPLANLIWTALSFIFTLLVLSYVFLGDNPLFRVATYIFVGVAAGYTFLVSFNQVIWPRLIFPLINASASPLEKALLGAPLLLGLLLLTKLFPRLASLGNISMAYLVGVGAAVAIGGAVLGTLFPQGSAAVNAFDLHASQGRSPSLVLIEAVVLLVGTAATLMYFYFGARSLTPGQQPQRPQVVDTTAQIGKYFIAITFGSLFAGVYIASISALVERVYFLWNTLF